MLTPKELGDKQIAAALSRDWDALRRLYADGVQYVDPDGEVRGSEAAIERLRSQEEALSDMRFRIESFVADERRAVAEWVLTATNSDPLTMPDGTTVPATNRMLSVRMTTIYDMRDGRIISERNYWDNLALYTQLGLLSE
jgi:steroid delta-isomerase-like uncharacterized protein